MMSSHNLRVVDNIPPVLLCLTWHEPPDCSSPRGWCHITPETHPDRAAYGFDFFADNGGLCCGNYLDYGPIPGALIPGPTGEMIHAVAYYNAISDIGNRATIRLGYKLCATIAQAKEWIEATVRAFLALAPGYDANDPDSNGHTGNGHNSNDTPNDIPSSPALFPLGEGGSK